MLDKVYKITNNQDWNNLQENENIVDISNDAYFGFRAMEKKAKHIIYDPCEIDSLVRVVKESKKFPDTIHILSFNEDTLGFDTIGNTEIFIKSASRKIEEIISMNDSIKIDLNINLENDGIIKNILKEIYKI